MTSGADFTPSSQAGERSGRRSGHAPQRWDAGVCLFTIANHAFALDTALVGEVVSVATILKVPRSPSAVLGLFSLRGTPVAVVDLLVVLRKGSPTVPSGELRVLVLRTEEGVVAGLRIDRLDAVVPRGKGQSVLTEGTEHPAIIGLYERETGQAPSVLLGGDRLLDSLIKTGVCQYNQVLVQPRR